jgi:3-hydroxybutyryl-CoA dehydrogenase
MRIILLADKEQKEEFVPPDSDIRAEMIWSDQIASIQQDLNADACIDLLFNDTQERIENLKRLQSKIIIINSVLTPLQNLDSNLIRINGWTTFLQRSIIEASARESLRVKAEPVFSSINKTVEWVPDIRGFISTRIVASIINEAYFALEENVSTKQEIDTAMKLGTNYPHGPFEWSKKIGLQNIYSLLKTLSSTEKRYEPAALLTKEAGA